MFRGDLLGQICFPIHLSTHCCKHICSLLLWSLSQKRKRESFILVSHFSPPPPLRRERTGGAKKKGKGVRTSVDTFAAAYYFFWEIVAVVLTYTLDSCNVEGGEREGP